MKIVGHRGARGLATENTETSIRAAALYDLYAIEFDIRTTKDDVVILHHDPDLYHVYGSRLNVKDTTFEELYQATAHHPDNILTLEAALEIIGKTLVFIEIKDRRSAELLPEILKNQPKTRVMGVSSFSAAHLLVYKNHRLKPTTPLFLAPTRLNWLTILITARKIGTTGVAPHYSSLLSPLHLIIGRMLNFEMLYYPVNNRILAKMLRLFNEKTYICTDYPDRFISRASDL